MHNRAYREMTAVPAGYLDTAPTLGELAQYGLREGILGVAGDAAHGHLVQLADLVARADGEPTEWTLASGRVLRRRITALPDGGRLLTYVDMTPQKRIEADLRAAKEAAEQASRAKSAFLANVSHEFRTPLNAINGYSELMLEDAASGPTAALRPDLERIRDAGRHLLTLINDILDLSKIEAGRLDVAPRACAVGPLIDAALATVRPLVRAGVELRGAGPAVHTTALGDPDRVGQILVNLLSNAAKFTDRGSIEVRVASGGATVTIAVADTGIGIAPEQHELVFEEFRQVARAPGRPRQGTGLGLAIARRLARLMGGDVTLVSRPGAGSTFTLVLPAA
jgi:signal transduction histidine kinase